MRRWNGWWACIAGGIIAGIGGACAGPSLDSESLGRRLRSDAEAAGLAVTSVSCPPDRPVAMGDRFTCTGVVAGGELRYDVEQTAGDGTYRYSLAPGQTVDGPTVSRQLAADIGASAGSAPEVACPPLVVAPGGRAAFDCTATVDGRATVLAVTVEPGRPPRWQVKPSP